MSRTLRHLKTETTYNSTKTPQPSQKHQAKHSSSVHGHHSSIGMAPPQPASRSRSRSPPRQNPREPKSSSSSGFRWKDKSQRRDNNDSNTPRLGRGYRDRSPRREDARPRERSPGGRREERTAGRGSDGKDGRDGEREIRKEKRREEKKDKGEKKEREEKKLRPAAPVSNEPMIIVNVNDRLGTKAAIPCLASDPVSKYTYTMRLQIPHIISAASSTGSTLLYSLLLLKRLSRFLACAYVYDHVLTCHL